MERNLSILYRGMSLLMRDCIELRKEIRKMGREIQELKKIIQPEETYTDELNKAGKIIPMKITKCK